MGEELSHVRLQWRGLLYSHHFISSGMAIPGTLGLLSSPFMCSRYGL